MTVDNTHRIRFEKPDLNKLTKRYVVVDMHFHSRYSDGLNTVSAIAKRARKLGIGVGITDHNEIRGAIEINSYKDVLSIPGIEITSVEGIHILVYFFEIEGLEAFYHDYVKPHMGTEIMSSTNLEIEEIIKHARHFKTVIIFPHPYCGIYPGISNSYFPEKRLKSIFSIIDGIEVINAENLNIWNLRSALLGFNLDKGITGGSDGHRLSQMGKVVSYASCEPNREAFLNAIINKMNKVIGKETDIIRKVAIGSVKLRRNIKNYPDLVEKNLKYSRFVINTKSKTFKDNLKRSLNEKIKGNRKKLM
jgi:predicted metal-dependent phosphoesterase TrpH